MEILKTIILIVAALFAGYRIFRTPDRFANVIVILEIAAVAIIVSGIEQFQITAFYTLLVSLLLATIYSVKKTRQSKRVVLFLVILPLLALYLFKAFHLQGIQQLSFTAFLSFGTFVFAMIKHKSFRNEMGFLSIMGAEGLIRILEIVVQSS